MEGGPASRARHHSAEQSMKILVHAHTKCAEFKQQNALAIATKVSPSQCSASVQPKSSLC